jgi:hypothetical protein
VTHQLTNLLQTLPQQAETTQRNYFGLQQTSTMSLEAYYEKFNKNIKLLKEVKIKDITPVAEVSLTTHSLHHSSILH